MKKILMMLALTAIAYTSAEAQAKKAAACGADEKQVCRKYGGQTSCYKTNYAQNFPVCKGANGYYICCNNKQAAAANNDDYDDIDVTNYAYAPVEEKRQVVCETSKSGVVACSETPGRK